MSVFRPQVLGLRVMVSISWFSPYAKGLSELERAEDGVCVLGTVSRVFLLDCGQTLVGATW